MFRLAPMPRAMPLLLVWTATPCVSVAQSIAVHAQRAVPRFAITVEAVASVLQQAGTSITASQVEMPLPLSTESPSPKLRVGGAELLEDGRMRVRLLCESSRDCLPFFAFIHFPEMERASSAIAILSSSFRPLLPIRPGGGLALRAGERTMLLLEDDHMRVSLPVVSIDSGAVGSEVRVSSLDRKKVYQGTVLSSQAVRGDLP